MVEDKTIEELKAVRNALQKKIREREEFMQTKEWALLTEIENLYCRYADLDSSIRIAKSRSRFND